MKKKSLKFFTIISFFSLSLLFNSCSNDIINSSKESSYSSASASNSSTEGNHSSELSSALEVSYSITCQTLADAELSVDKTTAKKGEVITIAINLTNEKKVVKKVVAGDCEVTTIEENKKYSFVMKDSNVLVTVELEDAPKKLHDIQVLHDEGISDCKILVNNSQSLQAKEGDAVDIHISLKDNFVIDRVDIGKIEFSLDNNILSFTMIDEIVNVNVFSKSSIVEASVLKFNCFSPTIFNISGLTIGEKVVEGTEKKIEVEVDKTYIDKFDYKYAINGIENDLVLDSNQETADSVCFTGSFIMPNEDIEVDVYPVHKKTTSAEGTKFTLKYNTEEVNIYGVRDNDYFSPVTLSYSPYFYFVVMPKDGFMVDKSDITVKTTYNTSFSLEKKLNMYGFYCSTSTKEVTISVTAKTATTKKITISNPSNILIEEEIDNVLPGTPIKFKAKALNGFTIHGIKQVSASSLYSSDIGFDVDTGDTWFIMPNSEVSLTYDISHFITFNVKANEFIESYYFTENSYSSTEHITGAFPNVSVKLYVTPKEGYEVTSILVNNKTQTTYGSYYTFTVENTINYTNTIEFVVAKYINVTYTQNEAYTLTISKTKYLPEKLVSFSVKENLGYKITEVKYVGNEITEILTDDPNDRGTYRFYAPNYDVEIIVNFEQVNTFTLTYEIPNGINNFKLVDRFNNSISSNTILNEGEELILSFAIKNGFTVNSVTINENVISKTNEKYLFTMVSENAVLNINIIETEKHNISFDYIAEDFKSFTLKDVTGNVTIATDNLIGYVGHTIQVSFTVKDDYYKQINTESFNVKTANGENVEFNLYGLVGVTFVMPNQDVVISAAVMEKELPVVYQDEQASRCLKFTVNNYPNIKCEGNFKVNPYNTLTVAVKAEEVDFTNNEYYLIVTKDDSEIMNEKIYYTGDSKTIKVEKSDLHVSLLIIAKN